MEPDCNLFSETASTLVQKNRSVLTYRFRCGQDPELVERAFQVATFLKHLAMSGILTSEQLETTCSCIQQIFEICGDRPSLVSLKILVVGARKALLSCYLNRSIHEIDFPCNAVRVRSHSFRSIAQYVEKPALLQQLQTLGETLRIASVNGVPTQIKNALADCVIQAQEFRFIHSRFHS